MKSRIAGVVLAGGQGIRMGPEPKVLMRLHGTRLVDRALQRASGQVGVLLLSSHLSHEQLGDPGVPVLRDHFPDFRGPLAGICSALTHLRSTAPAVQWLCTFAADTPWFPLDLVGRLTLALGDGKDADIAIARSAGRQHPVFALWPVAVLPALMSTLEAQRDLSLTRFQAGYRVAWADWPGLPRDPFSNLNTPEDFALAEAEAPEPRDNAGRIG